MAKKSNKKNFKTKIISNSEFINLIKIVAIVSLVLLVFYFITVLVDKKITMDSYKADDQAAVIQYDKILVGEILNRKEGSYYVLVEKEDDPYIDLYEQYFSTIGENDEKFKKYVVDLDDIFNKESISDETKVVGNDPSKYKFSATTLLKVDENKLVGVYSDSESIIKYLDTLIK